MADLSKTNTLSGEYIGADITFKYDPYKKFRAPCPPRPVNWLQTALQDKIVYEDIIIEGELDASKCKISGYLENIGMEESKITGYLDNIKSEEKG